MAVQTQEAKIVWSAPAIGEAAGQVWSVLSNRGKSTLSQVEREVDLPVGLTHMAIGWLAREGKLQISQDKRSVQLWLIQ